MPDLCNAPSTAQDEAEIRALFAAWARKLEARDLDSMMAGYSPDIVLFDVNPPYKVRGIEAYRASWEACLACLPEKFTSEHRDLEITVSGDAAFAHCLHHIVPVGDASHPMAQTWVRVTVGLHRIDGQWKAVHEHVSLPFEPMTGKVSRITDQDIQG